jgi:hypothetical protein
MKGRVVVGLDLHSYGQLIMRPYGCNWDTHPSEPLNKRMGDAMRDAIQATTQTQYMSQKSVGLYPVTGGLDDWMSLKGGMIGFTIELRDTGRYGFVLPPTDILPTGQEIWAALKAMVHQLLKELEKK